MYAGDYRECNVRPYTLLIAVNTKKITFDDTYRTCSFLTIDSPLIIKINSLRQAGPPNWKLIQIQKSQKGLQMTGRTDKQEYYNTTQGI